MRDSAADAISRRAACAAAGLSPDRGLAGYELFRRRILGMLRKSAAAPLAFAKVCRLGAKLLAMQRGAL
jgi:hypothetical protein